MVKVDLDGIHNRIVGLEITPGNYRNIRMIDDRVFYLRRTAADDAGDDEDDDGPERPEIASLLLQPGGSQGDRPRRREQLSDHVRRQENAGQDQKGLRHHRSAEGQDRNQGSRAQDRRVSTCSWIGTRSGTRSTSNAGGKCAISFSRRT